MGKALSVQCEDVSLDTQGPCEAGHSPSYNPSSPTSWQEEKQRQESAWMLMSIWHGVHNWEQGAASNEVEGKDRQLSLTFDLRTCALA